mmetsp:Transcript_43840/g.105776  ORF Transcript_43840/g.105776 Transcript_43840/m.105776 type:complete len:470 (+) Transcript_43840:96-1505(+)
MAYRLKEIKFKERPCHILLQNENGPCPLLAAANVLLLKDSITLPSNCIGAGVITIDELLNVLAEKILTNKTGSDHHIQEVMDLFPTLQFGMDVNPKFTDGPTGVEYTPGLDAFDLLHMEMVHGWLLDPQSPEFCLVEGRTYNQLINAVIEGNDAGSTLEQNPNAPNHEELSTKANEGTIIHHFLESSGHQLTQYGLTVLHEYLKDDQMAVFFRNNHFNSLIKHQGHLYLLITDIGYASVGNIVWEKLDVIDGDTEYVNQEFQAPPPMQHHEVAHTATGEQLIANDLQSQADYQLALQLSQETTSTPTTTTNNSSSQPAAAASPPPLVASPPPAATTAPIPIPTTTTTTNATTSATPTPDTAPTPAPTPPARISFNGQEVAVAVPTDPTLLSEEERDRMVALQLQQQEEKAESMRRQQQEANSHSLALQLQREEDLRQQQQSSASAQAQAASNANARRKAKGKDGDCVIM